MFEHFWAQCVCNRESFCVRVNAFKHADRCVGSSTFSSPISVRDFSNTFDFLILHDTTGIQCMYVGVLISSPVATFTGSLKLFSKQFFHQFFLCVCVFVSVCMCVWERWGRRKKEAIKGELCVHMHVSFSFVSFSKCRQICCHSMSTGAHARVCVCINLRFIILQICHLQPRSVTQQSAVGKCLH